MWAQALSATVGNKAFLAAWLLTLTMATGTIGDKVYVSRTEEITRISTQLDSIKETLKKMDATLDRNSEKLTTILEEQARVKSELDAIKRRVR